MHRCFLVVQQRVQFIFHSHIEYFGRGESDVPLTKTALLPPTVEGDHPVTFTSDILTHRPNNRVTGSGSQERHAVLQLDSDTEKQKKRKTLN